MKEAGLVEHIWLAGATSWSGTRELLATDRWSLFQKDINVAVPGLGFRCDGNISSAAFPDFGQFTVHDTATNPPGRVPTATLMEVTARSGLRIRSGPDTSYQILSVLSCGTLVEALRQVGDWVEVDLEGDGATDGFMHGAFLRAVSGGLPLPPGPNVTPLSIARAELACNVAEIPGDRHNPRIVLYHGTTSGGAAPDEIPWCSSFVNYCVEQAGLRGTDSKWAMSWHDQEWSTDATADPREGDIAVFRRRKGSSTGTVVGGHVGFWLADRGERLLLLGGNQSNRINITEYPKNGRSAGATFYELLSIRRP
jgi:uncharacterized protein (TIGR02594 family)